jgi:hypothetical protein
MPLLTKSRFLAGLQCPKRLWLELHEPLPAPALVPLPVLEGRRLDALVQRSLPGVLVARDGGLADAVGETARLFAAGVPERTFQPAFQADGLAAIADMVECRDGSVTLSEVKATTGVRDEHVSDVGFQAMVLRAAGVPVDRMQVVHLDGSFVLRREGDHDGMLQATDVTSLVEERLPSIRQAADLCLETLAGAREPPIRMGAQCRSPSACPYIGRCTLQAGGQREYPVEILRRSPSVVRTLRGAGYADLRDVPADKLKGALHRRIHQATVTGEPFIDRAAARTVARLLHPIAYLDFETVAPAIPERIGTRPWQMLPFQFSVHVEHGADDVRHVEHLATTLPPDLEALADALVAAIPDDAAVLAYNASFENGVLLDLAGQVPAQADALREIAARLVDLLPITRRAYYHPAMKGSWSFKAVLPTIDATLDYGNLDGVQEGASAQLAFLEMVAPGTDELRRAELRRQLLTYCGRDTWGMVVLRRMLAGSSAQAGQSGGRP